MANRTTRKINTEEIALRIADELNDFHASGLIESSIVNKRSRFVNLIRAINHADRIVTRDMNLEGYVIVFAPASTNNIIFSQNADFASEYYDDLVAQQADLINSDFYYFTGVDQYLDVLDIYSRYVYVFDQYPTGGIKPGSRLKKRAASDFYSRQEEISNIETSNTYVASPYYDEARDADSMCYFIPDEGRLVLEQQFATAKFLGFEARLMPGIVNLSDLKDYDRDSSDYDIYKIKTPQWGMELLVYEALDWLIPLSAPEAKNLVKAQKMEQKRGFEDSSPGDSNVIVPHFSWG